MIRPMPSAFRPLWPGPARRGLGACAAAGGFALGARHARLRRRAHVRGGARAL